MKSCMPIIGLIAVAVILVRGSTVCAGVIMAQTSVTSGPHSHVTEKRTVYVQGNKQKVEVPGFDTITDLDQGVFYVIDKDKKEYVIFPLTSLKAAEPAGGVSESKIQLAKTGKTRLVANNLCKEYRGVTGNDVEHITFSACVSDSAPGASEIAKFARSMAAQLHWNDAKTPSAPGPDSLILERKSTVRVRVPNLTQESPYDVATLSTEIRVDHISNETLPPATFVPPKEFQKLQPRTNGPEESPVVPGDALQVMALFSPDAAERRS